MDAKAKEAVKRLMASSLEKCLGRLSRVGHGAWRMDSACVFEGTLEDAVRRHDFRNPSAAVVHFNVIGEYPLVSMLFFDPDDMGCVASCFLGDSFSRPRGLSNFEETMLLELGNIVLNSLVGSVSDSLKKILTPSIPRCIKGNAPRIIEEMGAVMDVKRNFRIIMFSLEVRSGSSAARGELFALIPGNLESELEKGLKEGGGFPKG